MLDPRYRMRDYGVDDLAAHAALLNRITPDRPVTVGQLRQTYESIHTPPMAVRQFAVEEVTSGQLVAAGGTVTPPDGIGAGDFWIGAGVELGHRGRGIGRHLTEALEGEARKLGALRLWASTRVADERDVRFLHRQGFVVKLHNWQSVLELASAPDLGPGTGDALRLDGIEITTLAEEGPSDPEVLDRVYALAAATLGDAPRLGAYVPPTFAQFAGMMLETPGFFPDAFFLARSGSRYVGMSNLERMGAEPDKLHQIFSATHREFRGRGIATELKRRGIRLARERGFRFLITENDSLNTPIWSINERLGYRREQESIETEKVLSPLPS
jgi:ribosomal protein S18 acetylase RimI-like enzyme